ncbi:hypothetical protein XocBAI20_07800 [Xanthomonas oryzae pv. oryzicola]|nr:hypothetical protein XocBAI20_07800 [Xanthomonas oryzae pv. oryzicola]
MGNRESSDDSGCLIERQRPQTAAVVISSPLKNPQTTSIARLHLRFRRTGIASFRYATSWFLAVFAHADTPSCRRAIACR